MSDQLIPQLSQRLSRTVPQKELARARLHLLDWLACLAGARGTEAAKVAAGISENSWERSCYLGNALEMDDVHRTALLHPGPVVWPAALSVKSAAMTQILEAGVRGYEAMIAVGSALDAHHYAHWHPSSSAGVFGSSAAMGSLLGFGAADYVNALGNAGSVAGGLWHMRHDTGVLTKQWHIYHAVRTGRDAALHAAAGARGPAAILEGAQGLFAAMTREPGELAGRPDDWLIEAVSFKPFAACRHAHPAIDAAMQLRAAGDLTSPFKVETFADALAFCDRPNPTSDLEAKFSLQHAIAVVADGRDAKPEDFTLGAIAALAELRSQVTVSENPGITARYPKHFGASVNGFEIVDTLGDPESPLSTVQLEGKMRDLGEWGGLAGAEADAAIEIALRSDDANALYALIARWLA